jgi:hypothetical protein
MRLQRRNVEDTRWPDLRLLELDETILFQFQSLMNFFLL